MNELLNSKIKGCNGRNGPDCRGRTDAQGVIRFKFRPENTQLSTDNVYENIDVVLPCKDPFAGKNVRAVGDWNTWTLVDPDNVMIFDEETCVYYLPVTGLEADKNYEWKVRILRSRIHRRNFINTFYRLTSVINGVKNTVVLDVLINIV